MIIRSQMLVAFVCASTVLVGCGSSSNSGQSATVGGSTGIGNSGGALGVGATPSIGGVEASGGSQASGGSASLDAGGTSSGAAATGGALSVGGGVNTGGAPSVNTGGAPNNGGTANATGGSSTTAGGAAATGGKSNAIGGTSAAGGTKNTGGGKATGGNGGGASSTGGNKATGGTSSAGGNSSTCTPNCSNKQCGSDGCNGTCGACLLSQMCTSTGTCQASTGTAIQVDAKSGLTPIWPAIYGAAFADKKTLSAATLDRFGGDCSSLYNWKVDAFNCGQDYQFQNLALIGFNYPPYNLSGIPAGMTGTDWLVTYDKQNSVDTLMTIPTIGWVSKDTSSIGDTSGNTPSRDAVQVNAAYMQQWVQHLVDTFGTAKAGGVKYYQLDNEVDNWQNMHSDVHPKPASATEIWNLTQSYASAIKAADPSAFVAGYGPATLAALIYSPLDQTNTGSDEPFTPPAFNISTNNYATWFLKQAANYEKQNGVRLIDCLDMHYPTEGTNPVQDVRSMWDPTYNENSWLTQDIYGGPIYILPRVQQWINANYPGLGICISEYYYYGPTENLTPDYSGVTEADALGVFGKYGLKLAAFWTQTTDNQGNITPTWTAFAMYRNYDGAGAHFGDYSVGASSPQTDVPVYAAADSVTSPTKLWVMIINKTTSAKNNTQVQLNNFTAGATAQMYQATGSNAPRKLTDVTIANGALSVNLPALSINLLVIGQ